MVDEAVADTGEVDMKVNKAAVDTDDVVTKVDKAVEDIDVADTKEDKAARIWTRWIWTRRIRTRQMRTLIWMQRIRQIGSWTMARNRGIKIQRGG